MDLEGNGWDAAVCEIMAIWMGTSRGIVFRHYCVSHGESLLISSSIYYGAWLLHWWFEGQYFVII